VFRTQTFFKRYNYNVEFQPAQLDLIQEISEYLTRGKGVYSVSDSKNQILSLTVSDIEKLITPNRSLYTTTISYVQTDESRGQVKYVILPGAVVLTEFQTISVNPDNSFEEKIEEANEALKNQGTSIHEGMPEVWADNLVSYISLGGGAQNPNFMDSAMGMESLKVAWYVRPDTYTLHDFGKFDQVVYLCQIIYETKEPSRSIGSILFRIVPQSIS
jgi:hypothetical protein